MDPWMNQERDVGLENADGLMNLGTKEIGQMGSDMAKDNLHLKDKFIQDHG